MTNSNQPLIEPYLLKEHAVAQYLAVSVQKIRVMRKKGEGPPFIKIGKSIRYTIIGLQAYISSLSNAPKVVLVEPKELTTMAPKSIDPGFFVRPVDHKELTTLAHKEHHVLSAMPMIDPNKEEAQKVLLQDIFKPSAIDFFD
jgi:hypothetical protein